MDCNRHAKDFEKPIKNLKWSTLDIQIKYVASKDNENIGVSR